MEINLFVFILFSYNLLWKIIDRRWDNQLHRSLHVASYYFNPMLHYDPEFKVDYEVKLGMYDCFDRLVGDIDEISKIDVQIIESFKSKSRFFGSPIVQWALNQNYITMMGIIW